MTKSKKNVVNFFFSLSTNLLDVLTPLITAPYVAHILLPSGNGAYSFSYSIVTFFYFFCIFGFAYYGQREIARSRDNLVEKSKTFYEIFFMKLIMSSISFSVLWILIFSGVFKGYTTLIKLLSIRLIATAIDISFLYQGEENFGYLFSRNVLVKIITIICVFAFVKNENDTWVYCLITVGSLLVGNITLFFGAKKELVKVSIKEIHPFTRFLPSLKLFFPVITSLIFSVLDSFLIGIIVKDNDLSNGCYQSADKIVKLSLVLITSIGTTFLPVDSHEAKNKDFGVMKNHLTISIRYCFFLGLPMTFGLIALSKNLSSWFFGTEYVYTPFLIDILSTLFVFYSFRDILGNQYLVPMQEDKFLTISISIGLAVNIILSIILLRLIGVYGAAIGSVVAELLIAILEGIFATKKKFICWKTLLIPIAKYSLSAVLMFLALYFTQKYLPYTIWSFFLLVLVGVTSYFLCLFIMRDKFIPDIYRKIIKKKKNKKV